MSRKIGVAAVGNVLDINCWSNIPYYFFKAGHDVGLLNEPWTVKLDKLNLLRYYWNLKQILMNRGKGGFQYSNLFLSSAEAQIPAEYFASTVISFNQVFPRASSVVKAGGKIFYYIDTTLNDLFNEPDYGITISESMKAKAIEQERRNYAAAAGVITMGSWSHASLIDFYNLPLYKIHQNLPGANIELPNDFNFKPWKEGVGKTREFVLGFVGKDWKRKGLPVLIDLKDELLKRGYRVVIKAIGSAPEELQSDEGVKFTGFIDKQNNAEEFIKQISSCDLGCLFSASEALGISTLEFIRVGVPVIGFYHQGLKDTLLEGASVRIAMHAGILEIADRVEYYIQHPEALQMLKQRTEELSATVTWEKTIQRFHSLL